MMKNRLVYLSLALATLTLILILVLITRWRSQAAFGVAEIVVTFAIGILGNVLATGWFIWMFQKDDAREMEDLSTTTKNINRICEFLYKRGIWVAKKRDQLDNGFYEKHYEAATKVDILGIANKGFMRNFYPGYPKEEFSLKHVKKQPLFKKLQSTPHFEVTVLYLDPESEYAKSRNNERENSETIQDLMDIGEALKKIRTAAKELPLSGRLEFMMFKENPHYSIFLAQQDDDESSVMVVGLLPKNMSGDDCPSVVIHQNPDHKRLFTSYQHHLQEIKRASTTVLRWDKNGIT
jgi:hypothetical protein